MYSGKGGGGLLKRVQGTFFSTDVFAMFLLYVLLWYVAVTRSVKNRLVTLVMLGCPILIGMTFSRGVWGATLLTVPLIMIVFIRRRQMLLTRLITTGVVILFGVALASAPRT